MKKLAAVVLVMALSVSALTACSGSSSSSSTAAPETQAATEAAAAAEETEAEDSGEAAAAETRELEDTVVIYSTQTDADVDLLIEMFNGQYPDTEVEVISGSIGELMARVDAEKENPQADVILGGLADSDGDVYHDLLMPYVSIYDDEQSTKSDGYYNYFAYQYVCFIENEELLDELGITVDSYEDLLQPELAGMIIQADPSASSSGWHQLQVMLAVMGDEFADDAAWDYVSALLGNCNGVLTTSSSTVYNSVYNGEYPVGLSYDSACITLLMSGADNVKIVWPKEGNTVTAFANAIVKDCQHPEAAKAIVDVMSSAEYQAEREKYAGSKGTNTTYVNAESYYPADIDDGVVPLDQDQQAEMKADIIEKWTSIWAANN